MDRRPWTDRDLSQLRERFPVEKTADLAASLGRTAFAVSGRARLLGLQKSGGRYERLHARYRVNGHAFRKLTPETAYVLGMILADGSINGDRMKVTNNRLDVILTVRAALDSNHAVKVPSAVRDRTFSLFISNAELSADLRRWGITENKSLTGDWPRNVPGQLFGSLLRGYFDGDGHANFTSRGGLRVKFTSGSSLMLRSLAGELHRRGLPLRPVEHDKGRPNANRLWYYGPAAARLGAIMYAGGGFCIAPKRQPFLDYAARLRDRHVLRRDLRDRELHVNLARVLD